MQTLMEERRQHEDTGQRASPIPEERPVTNLPSWPSRRNRPITPGSWTSGLHEPWETICFCGLKLPSLWYSVQPLQTYPNNSSLQLCLLYYLTWQMRFSSSSHFKFLSSYLSLSSIYYYLCFMTSWSCPKGAISSFIFDRMEDSLAGLWTSWCGLWFPVWGVHP